MNNHPKPLAAAAWRLTQEHSLPLQIPLSETEWETRISQGSKKIGVVVYQVCHHVPDQISAPRNCSLLAEASHRR